MTSLTRVLLFLHCKEKRGVLYYFQALLEDINEVEMLPCNYFTLSQTLPLPVVCRVWVLVIWFFLLEASEKQIKRQ